MVSLNLIFKVVFGFYLAAFIVMRGFHFYHGFRHGLSTLDGDLAMGEKCRTDIVIKARTPECSHWESVTRMEPFWTGCEHLWNNSFILISISVADAAKHIVDTFGMFIGYIVGVGMMAVIVGVVFIRLIMTVAPKYDGSSRDKYIESGEVTYAEFGDAKHLPSRIEFADSKPSRYRVGSNRQPAIEER